MKCRTDLVVDERADAGAVVGLEACRREHPVPAELWEVYGERVATAALFWSSLVTVEIWRRRWPASAGVIRSTSDLDLNVRLLRSTTEQVTRGHAAGSYLSSQEMNTFIKFIKIL